MRHILVTATLCLLMLFTAGAHTAQAQAWQTITWNGFSFQVPSQWVVLSRPDEKDVAYGLRQGSNGPPSVFFGSISRASTFTAQPPMGPQFPPQKIGTATLAGQPATLYSLSGKSDQGSFDIRAACQDQAQANGDYVCFMGGVINTPYADKRDSLDQVFSSLGIAMP